MSDRYYKPKDRTRFVAVPTTPPNLSSTWHLFDRTDERYIASSTEDWCSVMADAMNRDPRLAPLESDHA